MTIHTRGFDFLKEVDVRLSVELGRTDMKLKDVLALGEESVVMLDRLTDELQRIADDSQHEGWDHPLVRKIVARLTAALDASADS